MPPAIGTCLILSYVCSMKGVTYLNCYGEQLKTPVERTHWPTGLKKLKLRVTSCTELLSPFLQGLDQLTFLGLSLFRMDDRQDHEKMHLPETLR